MGHTSKLLGCFILAALLSFSANSHATVVQFQTVLGDFEVELYDQQTPITTANFLAYVESGAYTDSIIHRSEKNFVVQGGGFSFDIENNKVVDIVQNASIKNEPFLSNTRGTIAMAKLGNQPHSATSQWFINLDDSNSALDTNNGGFTVFGKVTGDGMAVVDEIAKLKTGNYRATHDAFKELPLRNVSSAEIRRRVPLTEDNLMLIKNIMVLDGSGPEFNASSSSSNSSASSLSSSVSSSNSVSSSPSSSSSVASSSSSSVSSSSSSSISSSGTNNPSGSNGGGGSVSWLMLLALLGAGITRCTSPKD